MEGCPHKNHEDHIAGKGMNSLSHFNLVSSEKIRAWQLTKVRNKKDVIDEARKEGKTVHFDDSGSYAVF